MNKGTALLNFVSILAYISLIGVWDVIWKSYELITLESRYELYILIATHIFSAVLLIAFNASTTLYGFGGSSSECERIENNPDESNQLFKIKYLFLFKK